MPPFLSRRGWGLGRGVFLVIFIRRAVHKLSARQGQAETDCCSPIGRSGHSYTLNTVIRRRRVSHKPCGLQQYNYMRTLEFEKYVRLTNSARAFLTLRLRNSASWVVTPPAASLDLWCSSALNTLSCNRIMMRSSSSSLYARQLRTIECAEGVPSASRSAART